MLKLVRNVLVILRLWQTDDTCVLEKNTFQLSERTLPFGEGKFIILVAPSSE